MQITAPESIAATAGLSNGDEILEVDGEPVQSWQDWRWAVLKAVMNEPTATVLVRTADGDRATYTLPLDGITVDESRDDPMLQLGVRP